MTDSGTGVATQAGVVDVSVVVAALSVKEGLDSVHVARKLVRGYGVVSVQHQRESLSRSLQKPGQVRSYDGRQ